MTNHSRRGNKDSQVDNATHDVEAADAAFAEEQTAESVSELQRLAEEVKQADDRALRAQAELENFRKRMRREMDDERRYAALPLMSELLPIIDNLERAIEASEKNQTGDDLLRGVKMVQSQFLSVLERHNCRRIGTVGEAFDPARHQAIAQEASSEHAAGTITRVAQHGYQLHDRVIRPAQVFVSLGADETEQP